MTILTVLLDSNTFSLITPDPGLLFWTFLIFVILWSLLAKFAFKPIAKALKDREEFIEDRLSAAEKAQQEMNAMVSKHDEELRAAKEERNRIIKQAREDGNKLIDEMREKAQTEYQSKLADATQEIANKKLAAKTEIKNQVGQIALEISEKVLRRELASKPAQEDFIKQLVEETNLN